MTSLTWDTVAARCASRPHTDADCGRLSERGRGSPKLVQVECGLGMFQRGLRICLCDAAVAAMHHTSCEITVPRTASSMSGIQCQSLVP